MGCSDPWDEDREDREKWAEKRDEETLNSAIEELKKWWKQKQVGGSIEFQMSRRENKLAGFTDTVKVTQTTPPQEVGVVGGY